MANMILIFLALWISVTLAAQPTVDTQYGKLRGLEMRSRGAQSSVLAFLGVPYAQPPLGDLRLALPQPPVAWEGERDATQLGPICPQKKDVLKEYQTKEVIYPELEMSEDCLYLNVYTPGLDGQRPVQVVIHGGGFKWGHNSQFINGTSLAAYEDIVIVSLNYRLGSLGNLYSPGKAWPSNLGLRDQQLALHWVRDNIAKFGGDPNSVTLNGESAGGIAVSAHVLAPSSRGLFHRAIVQSASIFTVFTTRKPQAMTEIFAAFFSCPSGATKATLECFRKRSVNEFIEAQNEGQDMLCWDQVWDGEFLPSDPYKAYNDGSYSKVDYISGITTNEGFLVLKKAFPLHLLDEPLNITNVKKALSSRLTHTFGRSEDNMEEFTAELLGEDIDQEEPDETRQRVTDILGEYTLAAPPYLAAKLHSAHVPNTYFYQFAHQPSFATAHRPSWHHGCDHILEMTFIFGLPFVENFLTEDAAPMTKGECAFSRDVMKYIANFVKTGNPNGEGLPDWKPFAMGDKHYQILQPDIKSGRNLKRDAMNFWSEKLRAIRKQDVTEQPKSDQHKRDEL